MLRTRGARAAEISANPEVRYAGAAAVVLAPVSGWLALLYVVLTVSHPLALAEPAGTIMSIVAAASAICLGSLALLWYRRPPQLRYANLLISLPFLIVLFNSSLHMVITQDERQTSNFMLTIVGAGIAILATPWNIGINLVAWASWLIGISVSGGDVVHWGAAMAMATLVGQLARFGRRSSLDKAASAVSMVADLSVHDPLTGLANRRGLKLLGDEVLAMAQDSNSVVTMAFIDVDGLKAVNDAHGHDRGDQLLLAVSNALQDCCRNTDVLARWGGDEFVVLAMGVSTSPAALQQQLLDRLATDSTIPTEIWQPSLSVGIAQIEPGTTETLESLIKRADEDMYLRRSSRRGNTPKPGSQATFQSKDA